MTPFEFIPATKTTPEVLLDAEAKIVSIKGQSLAIDAFEFFSPINKWINGNAGELEGFRFLFSLSYYNSSSVKSLSQVIRSLKEIRESGRKIEIVWYVEDEDDFMREAAEYFMEIHNIEITIAEV